ncbi:MAG: glycosyltransferase [Gammaproteobacteria bacterium]|nr:glycosyltransferase [Gammaproteobacteria bacterium]
MGLPLVSVIMAVHNDLEEYVRLAIESILAQTYVNIEFIIINDFPDGALHSLLEEYARKNSNIVYHKNKKNIGLAASLNFGVNLSSGEYIARMDADDISFSNRIELQLKFLILGEYDLVGSFIERIDSSGNRLGISMQPPGTKLLKLLPYATIAFHPTWFAKRDVFITVRYNPNVVVSQDYDFLHRAVQANYSISNVDQVLVQYRTTSRSTSLRKSFIQINIHYFVNRSMADNEFDIDEAISFFLKSYDKRQEVIYLEAFSNLLQFIEKKDIKCFLNACKFYCISKCFRYKVKNLLMSKILYLM